MPIRMVLPTRDTFCTTSIQFPTPVSDEELMRISRENPGMVVERLGYSEIVMSPSGMESDQRSGLVIAQLRSWAIEIEDGYVFGSNAGFRVADGSILSPDAAWMSTRRLEAIPPEVRTGFGPVCPEIVVEVVSPSDSIQQLRRKCTTWIEAGALAAILINADQQSTEVFTPNAPTMLTNESVVPVPGFPDLRLEMEEIWRGLRGNRR